MKIISILILLIVLVLISVLGTSWYVSPGPGALKTPVTPMVEFTVAGNKLEVTAPDCTKGSKKGCIRIKKKNSGQIKYVFTDPSNTWRLSELKICEGKVATDADKAGLDCKLGMWDRLEFFVVEKLNQASILTISDKGVIDLSKLSPGADTFYLLDQNDIKEDYFYTITACRSADNCISTDPPIVNGGRGWN
jgi:hypothetical protein